MSLWKNVADFLCKPRPDSLYSYDGCVTASVRCATIFKDDGVSKNYPPKQDNSEPLPPTKEDNLYVCPFCERKETLMTVVIIENGANPKAVCTVCGEMRWSDIVRGAKENHDAGLKQMSTSLL